MDKLMVLSRYHFRKNKGQYISFAIITLIAALIFSVGLVTMRNFSKMYEEKFEKYHCADVFYTLYDNDYRDTYEQKVKTLEGVEATEVRENIMLSGDASYAKTGNTLNHIFFNLDDEHKMNDIIPLVETLDLTSVEHPVYISYWIKANGCELGDTYKFVSNNVTYNFTIAGFVEDLMYGNNNCGNIALYLPQKDFLSMYQNGEPSTHAKTLSIRLTHRDQGKAVFTSLSKMLVGNLSNNYLYTYGYFDICQRNRSVTADIVASLLMAVSALLVIITMFVINFRIKSGIEEEMQNMGVLTAAGYTGRQVIWSVAIPYIMLATLAVVLGLLGSYAFLSVIQNLFGKLSGLLWEKPLDIIALLLVALLILGLVLFTTLYSAKRIKKLHPIEALRSGIKHHSFKKNRFPLEKTRTNLHIAFGLKGFMYSIKQGLFLFVILVVVTFTTIFMASGLYNSIVKPDNFINLVSEENATLSLTAHNHREADAIRDALLEDERVKQVMYYDTTNLVAGGESIGAFILDEYEKLINDICYEGRYAKHANEIVLGSTTANTMNVGVGDNITITSGNEKAEYLIVGLMQSPNYNGAACAMTSQGFTRLKKDFTQKTLYVYLKDSTTSKAYMEEVLTKYKDQLANYCDVQSMLDSIFDIFIPIMGLIIGVISVIVTALIIAVLYMIIKTVVTQRKQELGISKALGYTTRELVLQLTYSLLPALSLGAIIGGILGYLYMNKLWLMCFYGIGIRKVNFALPLGWAVIAMVFILFFSTLVTVLLARRIKHITPMELIKE